MGFFKREIQKVVARVTNTSPKPATDNFDPIPVAEVTESTWNEWEDSVAFQNSQMSDHIDLSGDLTQPADLDPFASVSKKGK